MRSSRPPTPSLRMRGCSTCGASPASSTRSFRTPGCSERPNFPGDRSNARSPVSADPRFRLSVNLYGSPALRLREFAGWKQDLIVGASLQVSPPLEPVRRQPDRQHRHRTAGPSSRRSAFRRPWGRGRWRCRPRSPSSPTTTNFFGGKTRSQDPIYSMQGHVIYGFRSGKWASLDATYFAGGRTTIDGVLNNDLQQNWRLGGDAGDSGEPPQFDQVLRQQRRVGAHRQQLRWNRRGLAIPLGRRAVATARSGQGISFASERQ